MKPATVVIIHEGSREIMKHATGIKAGHCHKGDLEVMKPATGIKAGHCPWRWSGGHVVKLVIFH